MFTFLEINSSLSKIVMLYPIQFLLVGVLLVLGLYELYYFLGIGRSFNYRQRKTFK
jgi:hypothetical protein